jgi:enamine deaminase RidA (YjgF/YER057c/UK114 family)
MDFALNFEKNLSDKEYTYKVSCDPREISSITEILYQKAFEAARSDGLPYPVRIWNLIPFINDFHGNLENYQAFCKGRKNVFDRFLPVESDYPAASAVGIFSNEISFRFLFSDTRPEIISNPFQVEAYRYPSIYGPTPPSFARACLHKRSFYLSGTASIRGHETLYPDNLEQQLGLTLENIFIILEKANLSNKASNMNWKVFLKNRDDIMNVKAPIQDALGTNLAFVHADICRSNLLIEIEGEYNGL